MLRPPTGIRISQYFRRNAGTGYASIPNITFSADFSFNFNVNAPVQDNRKAISFRNTSSLNEFNITSSLIGNDGKLRVFSNAIPAVNTATSMDVFDNIFHAVRFEYSIATTSFRVLVDGVQGIAPTTTGYNFSTSDLINLWRQAADGGYMAGILSDLEMYDAGSLVRDYPMNDNSTTLVDLASGEDGTIVNGTADQWGLFQKQAAGEWEGQDQSLISEARLPAEYTAGSFSYWNTITSPIVGIKYRLKATMENSLISGGNGGGWSGSSGVPGSSPYRREDGTSGFVGGDYTADSADSQRLFYENDIGGTAEFNSISVKEVLNVA
jgi:hypothetical protein